MLLEMFPMLYVPDSTSEQIRLVEWIRTFGEEKKEKTEQTKKPTDKNSHPVIM